MPVPEFERRKDDINEMSLDHPLRHMTLSCLADEPGDRLRAGLICRQLAILKTQRRYHDSVGEAQGCYANMKRLEGEVLEREEEIQRLRDEVQQKVDTIAMVREECLEEKQRALAARDKTIQSLKEECEKLHREMVELRTGMGNEKRPISPFHGSLGS